MQKIRILAKVAAVMVLAACVAVVARAEDQQKLIEVLKSSAAPAEKATACKLLAVYGNQDAVPALAALLGDRELSSWARIALEAIPGPAADAAMREALGKVQGRLRLGVINSLAVRHDAKAVDALAALVKDADVDVAATAAVALGRIGGDAAVKALEPAMASAQAAVRSAAAEGCILCAEKTLAAGNAAEAVKLYDAVRKANVPAQRVREAIRGTILAQGAAGVPLLVEQLQSAEKAQFALGLRVARELSAPEVTAALVAQLAKAAPDRQGLLILALADRGNAVPLDAVLQVAKSGPPQSRSVAIRVLERLGNASCLPVLLDAAQDADEEIAQAALAVLADMPGADVDKDMAGRLSQAQGKMRQILIEIAGRRPLVVAVPMLLKAADDADAQVRGAAIVALGSTIEAKDLPVLIAKLAKPQTEDDAAAAGKALEIACQRMPDREAATKQLVVAMSGVPAAVKIRLLETLTAVGGAGALQAVAAAVKDSDPEVQDAGSRLLGAWMDVDVAPVLLDLAKNAADQKYQIRAMRGYIRLVRQFTMSDADRVAMCRAALETAQRSAEKKLVLEVMGRYPSPGMLPLALEATKIKDLKNQALAVAMLVAGKTGARSVELQKLLAEGGRGMAKIEIVKAEYGAGTNVKDVTTILRKHVHDFPIIVLPSPSYNGTFGGDPAPGKVKQLKVQYRMDGKAGEVSFQENASIELPKPKK
jgi:HEAT repeat protein